MKNLRKALSFVVAFAMIMTVLFTAGVNKVDAAKKVKVKSITLSETSLTLTVGEKATLKATVSPKNATNKKVSFTSSKSSIASVNAKGVIKAKKAGTAKITVKAKDGSGKKAVATVKVIKKQATEEKPVESKSEEGSSQDEEPAPAEEKDEEPAPVEESSKEESKEETSNETAYPKAQFAGKAKKVEAVIDAPKGAFPEGTTVEVKEVDSDKIEDGVKAAIDGEIDRMETVDISFSNAEGKEIEPEKAVDVTLTVDAIEEDDIIDVIHTDDDGNTTVVKDVQVDTENNTVSFKADAFSSFTVTWRSGQRTVTVKYVDENGDELTISNPNNTHPNLGENDFSTAYLIYDIDGYEYSYTYRNNSSSRIAPYLTKSNWNRWQYVSTNGQQVNELDNGDTIYVVYKKKTDPTTGGTPVVQEDEWPEEGSDDAPQFGKTSQNNGNGTNTITLTIKGTEAPVTKATPADVIVVVDVSRSMSEDMNGQTRLVRAQTAINTMANSLLNNNDTVRMALISFSNTANTVQGFTTEASDIRSAVRNLSADGGTNWEKALSEANNMQVRSDAATFVVFVTDGDPTFRVTRGDITNNNVDSNLNYYRNYSVYGNGLNDNAGRNLDFAVDQVAAIAGKNKQFYAIGISSDVTKVQNLTTQGGVAADHAFLATDSTAMENAFRSITESIQSVLGFGDVEMTDGITSLSNTEMKVLVNPDPNSFRYYRYGGYDATGQYGKYGQDEAHKTEWTTRAADGCAAASYDKDTGTVHWDMGETFQLEGGVTYVLTFDVWPSQEAYDLIADLNNGLKEYSSLTQAEKDQVVVVDSSSTPVKYALKTNTENVNATYSQTSKTGDTVTVSGEQDLTANYTEGDLQNMGLDTEDFTVVKEWNNDIDGRESDSIRLNVTKDGALYLYDDDESEDQKNAVEVSAPTWTSSTIYISCGVIKSKTNGYEVLEKGHDYTVTEPINYSYYWDLTAEVYHPMVIDGTTKMLVLNKNVSGTEGEDYYVINGLKYEVKSGENKLTATNDRRSVLDLKKIVTSEAAPAGDLFTYTVTVGKTGEDDIWFSAQDSEGLTVIDLDTTATAEMRNGSKTGYYYITAGTEFTVKIANGWNLRFINLPTGTEYSIEETSMTDTYGFVKAEAEATGDSEAEAATITERKAEGTANRPNTVYKVTYTNEMKYFYVYHSSDNTIERISMTDERVKDGKFDMTAEVKVGDGSVPAYLYGGYFNAYGGQKNTDAETINASYDANNWASDATGATRYTGSKANAWKSANAYTEKGTAMTPIPGTVYYLKEVPNAYLRPYIQIVYDKNNNNTITALYCITAVDDANYTEAGFNNGTSDSSSTSLSSTIKITNTSDSSTTALTARSIFNGKSYPDGSITLPRGYLTSIETSFSSQFDMQPYFKTLDGVKVYGVTNRTVKPGDGTFVDNNGVGQAPGITSADVTKIRKVE